MHHFQTSYAVQPVQLTARYAIPLCILTSCIISDRRRRTAGLLITGMQCHQLRDDVWHSGGKRDKSSVLGPISGIYFMVLVCREFVSAKQNSLCSQRPHFTSAATSHNKLHSGLFDVHMASHGPQEQH